MTEPTEDIDAVSIEAESDDRWARERDGVRSLHDTQDESGDEDEVDDLYILDHQAAREAGAALNSEEGIEDEPNLD